MESQKHNFGAQLMHFVYIVHIAFNYAYVISTFYFQLEIVKLLALLAEIKRSSKFHRKKIKDSKQESEEHQLLL